MYVRQRLRLCMISKHPTVRKAQGMKAKWNIEFFAKIGLVPENWYYFNKVYGYTIEKYVERQQSKNKIKRKNYIEKLKSEGKHYYTKARQTKISYALSK